MIVSSQHNMKTKCRLDLVKEQFSIGYLMLGKKKGDMTAKLLQAVPLHLLNFFASYTHKRQTIKPERPLS